MKNDNNITVVAGNANDGCASEARHLAELVYHAELLYDQVNQYSHLMNAIENECPISATCPDTEAAKC